MVGSVGVGGASGAPCATFKEFGSARLRENRIFSSVVLQ
jgi:hypothetical protein